VNLYGTIIETRRKLEVESPAALGSHLASPAAAFCPKRELTAEFGWNQELRRHYLGGYSLLAPHSDYDTLTLGSRISTGRGSAAHFARALSTVNIHLMSWQKS
jgi:hypothetical protein